MQLVSYRDSHYNKDIDNSDGVKKVEAIERILKDLHAEHASLIQAFKQDLESEDDAIARGAWKHIDKAAGIEKALLIVGKELGL